MYGFFHRSAAISLEQYPFSKAEPKAVIEIINEGGVEFVQLNPKPRCEGIQIQHARMKRILL